MSEHEVQQGEHLSGIALIYGFTDYQKIWNDPKNAQLKKQRQNPNVLLPGDTLFIPEKQQREENRSTGKRHEFVAPGRPLKLRLAIKNESGEAVANTDAVLQVDADASQKKTDGKGRIVTDLPALAKAGRLIIKSEQPLMDLDAPIDIGHLDPIDTQTGQIGRLNNLGYDAGLVQAPADDDAELQLRSAIEEFQCNSGLKVDGVCGPATQAKLKDAHGC